MYPPMLIPPDLERLEKSDRRLLKLDLSTGYTRSMKMLVFRGVAMFMRPFLIKNDM